MKMRKFLAPWTEDLQRDGRRSLERLQFSCLCQCLENVPIVTLVF